MRREQCWYSLQGGHSTGIKPIVRKIQGHYRICTAVWEGIVIMGYDLGLLKLMTVFLCIEG
jgi:hypothetical protein